MTWEPKGGIDAFRERCLDKRGKGKTWRQITADEGISHVTYYEWRKEHPEFQEGIKKEERALQNENIRQTLLYMAVEKKNVTALIFLHKARLKMYDQPHPKEIPSSIGKPEDQVPAMTPEQAREQLKARLTLVQEKP